MCNKDFLSTSGSSTPTRDILIPRFLLKVRNTLIQSSTRLSHFPEGETTQKSRQGEMVISLKVVEELKEVQHACTTVNPLLSPQGGFFFSSTFERGGGLNREVGLKREGGLI